MLGPAIARLTQSLTVLTTSHMSNTAAMSSLAEEREQLDKREQEMREMVRKAEAKRSWFVAFREWVESVATFLDEKVCTIVCAKSSGTDRDWFHVVSPTRKTRRRACIASQRTIGYNIPTTSCR